MAGPTTINPHNPNHRGTNAAEYRRPCENAVWVVPPGVKHVRLLWTDASGLHRCKVVPAELFLGRVKRYGAALTQACMAMTIFSDAPAENSGLGPVGEIRLHPEYTTLHPCIWHPTHAMAVVDMREVDSQPWFACPRAALKRAIQGFKEKFHLEPRVGFEVEFLLLTKSATGEWVKSNNGQYCSSAAYEQHANVLEEITGALTAMNIDYEQVHAESAPSQYEISVRHKGALEAADDLLIAKEVITCVAAKHGLKASFVPKMFESAAGNGAHMHLSVWSGLRNAFAAHGALHYNDTDITSATFSQQFGEGKGFGMSNLGENIVAGVLYHLPSILALTSPTTNSYRRFQPGSWAGAYVGWGIENREVPLRVAMPPGPGGATIASNLEVKCVDGAANPYLALAGILFAGLDGMENKRQLPAPVAADPGSMTESQRAAAGLKPLPSSLSEALTLLENDKVIHKSLGEGLVKAFTAVKKAEIKFFEDKLVDEELAFLVERL